MWLKLQARWARKLFRSEIKRNVAHVSRNNVRQEMMKAFAGWKHFFEMHNDQSQIFTTLLTDETFDHAWEMFWEMLKVCDLGMLWDSWEQLISDVYKNWSWCFYRNFHVWLFSKKPAIPQLLCLHQGVESWWDERKILQTKLKTWRRSSAKTLL